MSCRTYEDEGKKFYNFELKIPELIFRFTPSKDANDLLLLNVRKYELSGIRLLQCTKEI